MKPTKDDVENFYYRYLRDLRHARDYMLTPELVRTEWKAAMGAKTWKLLRDRLAGVLATWDALEEVVLDAQP